MSKEEDLKKSMVVLLHWEENLSLGGVVVEICGAEYLMERTLHLRMGVPLGTLAYKAALHAMMRFYKARQGTISEKEAEQFQDFTQGWETPELHWAGMERLSIQGWPWKEPSKH